MAKIVKLFNVLIILPLLVLLIFSTKAYASIEKADYRSSESYLSLPLINIRKEKVPNTTKVVFFNNLQYMVNRVGKESMSYSTSKEMYTDYKNGLLGSLIVIVPFIEYYTWTYGITNYLSIPASNVALFKETLPVECFTILIAGIKSFDQAEINKIIGGNTYHEPWTLKSFFYSNQHVIWTGAVILFVFVIAWLLILIKKYKDYKKKVTKLLTIDKITGLLSGNGFDLSVPRALDENKDKENYLIQISIVGIENYSKIFSQSLVDTVLLTLGNQIKDVYGVNGIYARLNDDTFVGLITDCSLEDIRKKATRCNTLTLKEFGHVTYLKTGICKVTRTENSVTEMIDSAKRALKSIENMDDTHIAVFDEAMQKNR